MEAKKTLKDRRKRAKKIRNLIVVSDLHAGDKMGLCPPGPVELIDGGSYTPSIFQAKVYQWWQEFWGEFVPRVCKGEPFCVAVNGESVDGVHHSSTTPISSNKQDQKNMAEELLAPVVEACEGLFFMVSGTPAHSGESGVDDEGVGKALDAIRDSTGRYARYELWKRVGKALVHLNHHIGTTGTSSYESTAVHKEMVEAFVEAGRWGKEPPDFVVRSHRHRHFETKITTHKGMASSIVTPGWQGKTPFAFRIVGGRQAQPQFGGIIIRQGDEDAYVREWVRSLDRPEEE